MTPHADDIELQPGLVLVYPFEHEGEHTVPGTDALIYLDHHWDDTFGFAFGTVLKTADNVTEVVPGDFIHFTRHAYEPWTDGDGDGLLFVNIDDIQAVFVPGENEGAESEGETADRVERIVA